MWLIATVLDHTGIQHYVQAYVILGVLLHNTIQGIATQAQTE